MKASVPLFMIYTIRELGSYFSESNRIDETVNVSVLNANDTLRYSTCTHDQYMESIRKYDKAYQLKLQKTEAKLVLREQVKVIAVERELSEAKAKIIELEHKLAQAKPPKRKAKRI